MVMVTLIYGCDVCGLQKEVTAAIGEGMPANSTPPGWLGIVMTVPGTDPRPEWRFIVCPECVADFTALAEGARTPRSDRWAEMADVLRGHLKYLRIQARKYLDPNGPPCD